MVGDQWSTIVTFKRSTEVIIVLRENIQGCFYLLNIQREYKIPAIIVGLIFFAVLVKAFTIKPKNKTDQSEDQIKKIPSDDSETTSDTMIMLDESLKHVWLWFFILVRPMTVKSLTMDGQGK